MNRTDRRGTWTWIGLLVGVVVAFVVGRELRAVQASAMTSASSAADARRAEGAEARPRVPVRRRDGALPSEAPATLVAAAPEEPFRLVPVYHPRPATEWQGMLVDVSHQALCERTEQCGLAMSCHEGRCGPCESDADCARGEGCVLDHCVPLEKIECRKRADCGSPQKACVLSGYSPDPRSNAGMRAYCLEERGGRPQVRTPEEEKKRAAALASSGPKWSLEHELLEIVKPGSTKE